MIFYHLFHNAQSIAIVPKPLWHVVGVFISAYLTSSTELRGRWYYFLLVQNLLE
jgi:hypothetical protein